MATFAPFRLTIRVASVEPPLAKSINFMRLGVSMMTKLKTKKRPTRNYADTLARKREKAIEQLLIALDNETIDGDGEEVNKALDVLTVTHAALAFEELSGPHKW
jgi:hypothetical protein